jgi:hypothetical protein
MMLAAGLVWMLAPADEPLWVRLLASLAVAPFVFGGAMVCHLAVYYVMARAAAVDVDRSPIPSRLALTVGGSSLLLAFVAGLLVTK